MNRKVPFLDLRILDAAERKSLLASVDRAFLHGRLVMGPEVQELEQRIAAQCNRQYAVGVNSGSSALFIGLKSLGIGPGDEVITTSLSWIATANAIALTGATPVFADIRDDLNIDPVSVKHLITPKTKAILPVHYTGKICRMPELMQLAETHRLMIVEDASQAFNARYKVQPAGSFGTIACFSMNAMKVFASCGDAGLVVTDQEDIYERLLALRYNGTVNRETCIDPSINARIDTLQAAILLNRLEKVEGIIQKRREIAAWYDAMLAGIVQTPAEQDDEWDVYYTYTIQATRRDELKTFLEQKGIETKIQHPILMPAQPAYRDDVRADSKNAERLVQQILSIPANEKITYEDVKYVAASIRAFYRS